MRGILLVIALAMSNALIAQSNLVKGNHYVALKYGLSKYSIPTYFNGEWGIAINEGMVLRSGLSYEHGNQGSTIFNNFYLNADFHYNIFNVKNRLFANMSLGPVSGMEFLKSDRDPLKDMSFVYGGKASAELDYLINTKWSLKMEFSQWYVRPSNLGAWFYTGTLGVGYVINN